MGTERQAASFRDCLERGRVCNLVGMTLYRYGWMAWVWRPLLLLFIGGGMVNLPLVLEGELGAAVLAAILLAPALFFGLAVATRIDQQAAGELRVWTLIGWRRRLKSERLGVPTLRLRYQTRQGAIAAPAVWVPVRGGLPVYVDLLGEIPDRRALQQTLQIPAPWQ
jgi:hypothetical protein